MKKGKINFTDVLGKDGKKYDEWLNKQPEGYYLTYRENFYSDEFDYSIQRYDSFASEPVLLAKNIRAITRLIDSEIARENKHKSVMER